MKHTFFTLTLFLLALLSTSCGNKKVAYQNPLPMAFGDPFLLKASDGKYYSTERAEYRTVLKYTPPMTW